MNLGRSIAMIWFLLEALVALLRTELLREDCYVRPLAFYALVAVVFLVCFTDPYQGKALAMFVRTNLHATRTS